MKKLIIILLFTPFILKAQQQAYLESNWGVCFINDVIPLCPGTSFLVGKTKDFNKIGFVDMQIGLAVPSILTAKIGVGKYLNAEKKSNISFGIRPWPLHGYTQLGFDTKEGKSLLITLEGGTGQDISFLSYGLVTIGFRWDINKKKNKELN